MLRSIVEGTATETGEGFFARARREPAKGDGHDGRVGRLYDETERTLRAISMKMRDDWLDGFSVPDRGDALPDRRRRGPSWSTSPIASSSSITGTRRSREFGPVSYLGVPLFDVDGRIIGQLAVLDDKPMPSGATATAIFQHLREPRGRRAPPDASAIVRSASERPSSAGCSRARWTRSSTSTTSSRSRSMNPAARACASTANEPPSDRSRLPRMLSTPIPSATLERLHSRARVREQETRACGSPADCARRRLEAARLRRRGDALALRGRSTALVHAHPARRRRPTRRGKADRVAPLGDGDSSRRAADHSELRADPRLVEGARSTPCYEVESVAATDTTVLLSGETGTGQGALRASRPRRQRAREQAVHHGQLRRHPART